MALTIVDTAGYEYSNEDNLERRMWEQTKKAIDEADVCLFLYDARAGLQPYDEHFANILRQAGKPVILLANKCESKTQEDSIYEAYKLGLGQPVPFSAEHGLGLNELYDALKEFDKKKTAVQSETAEDEAAGAEDEDKEDKRPIQLAIVGRPNVGKSTLVNEILYKTLAAALNGARSRPGQCEEVEGMEWVDKVIGIDQSPIGRTPRSNPATYTGVFGDIRGMRKKLFTAFLLLGVVSVAGLAFTPLMDFTSSTAVAGKVAMLVLVLYILSTIGFDASCIYYDAFLTDVTTEDRMDSVSTLGYGLGYIGGSTIPLLIFLIMNAVGVPMLTSLAIIFAITAVWWLVFSLPLLKNCEQTTGKPYEKGDIGASIKNVFTTMKEIGADKPMLVYILSYFFYIDGVHTIISMSTSYGTNLGLDSAGMLLALLLVQVLGLPFCLLYMKLAARFGARTMVGVGICVYMFICIFAYFMNSLWQFWMLAVLCATSQGGIQALSRSMFGKLIPDKSRSGEFFGFFDIFGKFSSIMGPALVGFVSAFTANKMLADQGLTAATATAEQVDAINAAAGPFGILSVILIIIVGAVLYFGVLPKVMTNDERKI